MTCGEALSLMDAYVDRELDVVHSLDFEQHLSVCVDCQHRIGALKSLGNRLRELYVSPPETLRRSVVMQVGVKKTIRGASWWTQQRRLLAMAASFVILVSGVYFAARISARSTADDVLSREVVASHVRSLMANHLTDVPSTDQHTVKPWFAGRLDFSPQVKDLSEMGFTLVGGRLDYLDDRPVAALVFQRRQHYINLFTWPTEKSDSERRVENRQGYNIISWTRARATYWAVSDLNAEELMTLAREFGE